MAECPFCTHPLPEGASFCPACGAPLTPPSSAAEPGLDPGADTGLTAGGAPEPDEATTGDMGEPGDTDSTPAPDDTGVTVAVDGAAEAAETRVLPTAVPGWTCARCGAQAPADDAFCIRCGARRPDEALTAVTAASAVCAACGAPLSEGAGYCPRCGARRGDVETAASRDETIVAPLPGGFRPAPPPPAQAPPPGQIAPGRKSSSVPVIALAVITVLATAAFAAWWFVGRPSQPTVAEDFVARVTPALQPVAAAQGDTDAALAALKAAAGQTFAAARQAGADLGSTLAAAREEVDGLAIGSDMEAQRDLVRSALSAHVAYAQAVAALPADAAWFTQAIADGINEKAAAASNAYATLDDAVPGLPAMTFSDAAAKALDDAAAQVAQADKAREASITYLQSIVAIFPDSAAARAQAEDVLAGMMDATIPADVAAEQMDTQADVLKAVLNRIDGLTPPQVSAAQQIQNTYHEAVQAWVSAARLYVKWMQDVWEYYQALGSYPSPGEGIYDDAYQSPDYETAKSDQKAADAARGRLATQVNDFGASLGLQMTYTASSM